MVTGDGTLIADVTQATLAQLFLAGPSATEGVMAEDTNMRRSSRQSATAREDDALIYFADPPCVGAQDEEEEKVQDESLATIGTYWKSHATKFDCWPQVRESCERLESFLKAWKEAEKTHEVHRAFVNVSPHSLGVRSKPSKDEADRTGQVIHPGQCILVDKVVDKDDIRYLKLAHAEAWVFDCKDGDIVMVEMKNVQFGPWWYHIVNDEFVETRRNPSYQDNARTGWVLGPKEVVVVALKCRLHGSPFVLLADGRGWVFVLKPGVPKNNKDFENMIVAECDQEVIKGTNKVDLRDVIPITSGVVEVGFWTYIVGHQPVLAIGGKKHGTLLSPGDIVKVTKRCVANGEAKGNNIQNRVWLRLNDHRGWVPTVSEEGKRLLTEETSNTVTYPSWYQGTLHLDKPQEEWMVGVV